ncbi:hypothetical protein GLOIN_2v1780679 [Rhizophagus irregularis DAOM 181602=DAOM 197198]|nr:hypothetical protein GLOIN_2v1780679 [Rhizophagus irregularis DAOM 181602=DAOM 197198]
MENLLSICCKLCFKAFTTYQKLFVHERNKHSHNKTIPHFYSLPRPTSEQMSQYINSFIILIKKKLGFSRHAIGKKRFSIETFPENIFVYLFKDEEKFKYSPAKHKYQCYVLLEDYENTYQVKFIWSQTVLLENNRKFTLGRMTCNFITDSGEFQENNINQTPTPNSQFSIFQEDTSSLSNNLKQPVKKKFRYILPRPLQDMNQSK